MCVEFIIFIQKFLSNQYTGEKRYFFSGFGEPYSPFLQNFMVPIYCPNSMLVPLNSCILTFSSFSSFFYLQKTIKLFILDIVSKHNALRFHSQHQQKHQCLVKNLEWVSGAREWGLIRSIEYASFYYRLSKCEGSPRMLKWLLMGFSSEDGERKKNQWYSILRTDLFIITWQVFPILKTLSRGPMVYGNCNLDDLQQNV